VWRTVFRRALLQTARPRSGHSTRVSSCRNVCSCTFLWTVWRGPSSVASIRQVITVSTGYTSAIHGRFHRRSVRTRSPGSFVSPARVIVPTEIPTQVMLYSMNSVPAAAAAEPPARHAAHPRPQMKRIRFMNWPAMMPQPSAACKHRGTCANLHQDQQESSHGIEGDGVGGDCGPGHDRSRRDGAGACVGVL